MINKPSLFDTKYQKMNFEETSLNYDRDMMLWEQTEALKRVTNSNNSYVPVNYTPHYTPNNCFDKDTPEHIKYKRLTAEYDRLYGQIYYLENNLMGFFVAILICIIVSLPVCICVNQDLAKTLGFIALPIAILPIILVKLKISLVQGNLNKTEALLEEMEDIADKLNTPKKFSRKVIRKQKPVKEVLKLKH